MQYKGDDKEFLVGGGFVESFAFGGSAPSVCLSVAVHDVEKGWRNGWQGRRDGGSERREYTEHIRYTSILFHLNLCISILVASKL